MFSKIDLTFKNKSTSSVSRPRSSNTSGSSLFSLPPPPPAGSRITHPSSLGQNSSSSSCTLNNVRQIPASTNPFGDYSFVTDSNVSQTVPIGSRDQNSPPATTSTAMTTVDNLL